MCSGGTPPTCLLPVEVQGEAEHSVHLLPLLGAEGGGALADNVSQCGETTRLGVSASWRAFEQPLQNYIQFTQGGGLLQRYTVSNHTELLYSNVHILHTAVSG